MSSLPTASRAHLITSGHLALQLQTDTGDLESLLWKGEAVSGYPALPSFAFGLDEKKQVTGFTLIGLSEDEAGEGIRSVADYAVDGLPGMTLRQTIEAGPQPHSLVRTFHLRTGAHFDEHVGIRIHQFGVTLTRLGLGPLADARASVPMARFTPEQSLSHISHRPRHFSTSAPAEEFEDLGVAPDCGLGVVLLSSETTSVHLALVPLAHESPVRTFVFGQAEMAAVEQTFVIELMPVRNQTYLLGRQVLVAADGPRRDFLRTISRVYAASYPVPADRPAWASRATVLEADFVHYGGIAGLTQALPRLQAQGFNTIYLMPWHTGPFSGYGTLDYWEIDPAKGTFAELKALTARAHELGLKVLFDLLVNMAMDGSPYLKDHPEWFYRDIAGQPQRHAIWPGFSLDPAAPGFRAFLRDYCRRCVTELGADGFRVDAVAYRGGNWNPLPGLQPHQHAHAIFTLLAEIRGDLRAVHPEAILLAECFGPAQAPCSDLICFQWVGWLDWVLERLIDGRLTGRDLSLLLRDHFGCMPEGAWLTTYSHTHDTVAFQGREWEGSAVKTFFAALSLLSAGSMTFGGGWDMRERPSEDELPLYRQLVHWREKMGGVAAPEVQFENVPPLALLVAERPSALGRVRLTANFSDHTVESKPVGTIIYSSGASQPGRIMPWDVVLEVVS